MRFEGNPEVLKNLFRKKQRMERHDISHQHIRPALLVCSGVMRGTYGVGQLLALHHAKLNHVFDIAVGVSTGAPAIAYLLAEQERPSIYWKEAASKEFISFGRFLRGKGPIVDIDFICRAFGDIEQEAVRRSRTEFYGGATCARTGTSIFLEMKRAHPDMVESIRASIALPGISKGEVALGDHLCLDGGGAMTFPVEQVVRKFSLTDLLVLANYHGGKRRSNPLEALLVSKYPPAVQKVYAQRHKTAAKELAFLRTQTQCRWAILWSDKEVSRFTRDPLKLEYAAVRAENHLMTLLTKAKKSVENSSLALAS